MKAKISVDELVSEWRKIGPVAWAQGPYGWIGEGGQPITLEPWQRAALDSWKAHSGDCSTLAISNIKKSGKTLLNAVLLAWRWLALPGVHFAIGNDLDQATARQFSEIVAMVKRNPYLSQTVRVSAKVLTFEPTGSTLQALASDAAGNAGANHLTASHTEAWGLIYESGVRSWEELTPPPGRFHGYPALRLADSYAGFEGQSLTWTNLVERGLQGERVSEDWPIYKAGGLLLFHMEGEEARERCYRGSPEEAAAYYADQRASLRPNAFIRMHSNQRTAGEAAFVPVEAWDNCYSPEVRPFTPGHGRRLVLGADASTSRDLTSLVGCEYDDKGGIVDVTFVRVWKPKSILGIRAGKPTVDLAETIGAAVMELHKAGSLAAVVCDPYQLHTLIVEWEKAGIRVIELAQNAGRVESDQALYDAIVSRSLRHYGDPALTEAVHNAIAIETPRGFRLAKEKASKKIDACVALSMAAWACRQSKYMGSGVGWFPDPFSDDVTEETYNRWEVENGQPFPGGRPAGMGGEKWNRKPHPAGVTFMNCPKRTKGCYACVAEMRAAGIYEQDKQDARDYWNQEGRASPEEVAERQRMAPRPAPSMADLAEQERARIVGNFKRAATLKSNQRAD